MTVRLFEEPVCAGWVYPCSLGDIRDRLTHLPEADLAGLWAVGLAAATRRDCWANGRYRLGEKPTIRLYSYAATYTYRQPPHTKRADIDEGLAVEREFGMYVKKGRRALRLPLGGCRPQKVHVRARFAARSRAPRLSLAASAARPRLPAKLA